MLAALRSLPATVWALGLVSLLNDAASEMVYPLVPLYLSSVLMAGPRALGLIEGLAEATASLLKLFSGVAVDRTRRSKPWLVAGYGLAALGRPLIALVTAWPALLAIRLADRIGKGLRSSPRDALLAASIAPGQRGLAFGLHRALDNTGAVVGPLAAAGLLAAGLSLAQVFLVALLPGIAVLALTLALKEPTLPLQEPTLPLQEPTLGLNEPVPTLDEPASRAPRSPAAGAGRFDWRIADLPADYRRYLLAVALFTLGNSSNMFLLLRARELGAPEWQVPLLWAAVSAIAAVFSTPLSALSDRVGRPRLILAGWGAYALVYFGLGWAPREGAWLYALFALYGLFMAATEGAERALVADFAPAALRGTAFGWFNLVTGAMLLPASLVFGWLYQRWGAPLAFAFSGTCALAAAGLLAFGVRVPAIEPPAGPSGSAG